jgi:hypothetical protein
MEVTLTHSPFALQSLLTTGVVARLCGAADSWMLPGLAWESLRQSCLCSRWALPELQPALSATHPLRVWQGTELAQWSGPHTTLGKSREGSVQVPATGELQGHLSKSGLPALTQMLQCQAHYLLAGDQPSGHPSEGCPAPPSGARGRPVMSTPKQTVALEDLSASNPWGHHNLGLVLVQKEASASPNSPSSQGTGAVL